MEKQSTNGLKMAMNAVLERSISYWIKKTKVPQELWNLIIKHANDQSVAIDLGCAGGRLCKALMPNVLKVFAIDKCKKILDQTSQLNPEITFLCGDFGKQSTWKKLNKKFDLIVSDCAIRKDYVDLDTLANICNSYLTDRGVVIFRMQALQDMSNIFPAHVRRSLFYNEHEIQNSFKNFELNIDVEFFVQKFSTNKYLAEYLKLINIAEKPESSLLNLSRQYYIVEAQKK
jgi:2-polyprenyl-3-methyl-5-hydroxy-6-metoxy-1,4-benzoquinol methylase